MAVQEINSDIDVLGRIYANTIPNSTGSIVTWNDSTRGFGLRTNAQIIADLGLNTVVSNSHTHTNKTVLDGILSTNVNNWNTAFGWGNHSGLYFPYQTGNGTSFDANTLNENGVRGNNLWTNTPDGYNTIGVLDSKVYNNGWVSQTFSKLNNPSDRNNFHFRIKHGGTTWTDWVRMWHSGDFKQVDINNWNTAFGWGNFRDYGLASNMSVSDLDNQTLGSIGYTSSTTSNLSGLPYGSVIKLGGSGGSGGNSFQIYGSYQDTSGIRYRRLRNGVLDNWIQVVDSNNLDSQATSLGFIKSSALSDFVPYTGATANVDLGTKSITSSGGFLGNASTATTLATTRTINGTSFNGSANITTSRWGTARNITIGNTTKSVNGSSNVSWSLAEIGAAGAQTLHDVLLTGNTAFDSDMLLVFEETKEVKISGGIMYSNDLETDNYTAQLPDRFRIGHREYSHDIIAEASRRERTHLLQDKDGTLAHLDDIATSLGDYVPIDGNMTISGFKTFSSIPLLPSSNPTLDEHAVKKGYVDGLDVNNVKLTGTQTIAGTKTFSTIPVLPFTNPTSANQAVRKAYVDEQKTEVVQMTGGNTLSQWHNGDILIHSGGTLYIPTDLHQDFVSCVIFLTGTSLTISEASGVSTTSYLPGNTMTLDTNIRRASLIRTATNTYLLI